MVIEQENIPRCVDATIYEICNCENDEGNICGIVAVCEKEGDEGFSIENQPCE